MQSSLRRSARGVAKRLDVQKPPKITDYFAIQRGSKRLKLDGSAKLASSDRVSCKIQKAHEVHDDEKEVKATLNVKKPNVESADGCVEEILVVPTKPEGTSCLDAVKEEWPLFTADNDALLSPKSQDTDPDSGYSAFLADRRRKLHASRALKFEDPVSTTDEKKKKIHAKRSLKFDTADEVAVKSTGQRLDISSASTTVSVVKSRLLKNKETSFGDVTKTSIGDARILDGSLEVNNQMSSSSTETTPDAVGTSKFVSEKDGGLSLEDALQLSGSPTSNVPLSAAQLAAALRNNARLRNVLSRSSKTVADLQKTVTVRDFVPNASLQNEKSKASEIESLRRSISPQKKVLESDRKRCEVKTPVKLARPMTVGVSPLRSPYLADLAALSPTDRNFRSLLSPVRPHVDDSETKIWSPSSKMVDSVKNSSGAPLPSKYVRLHKFFLEFDKMVAFLFTQHRRITLKDALTHLQRNLKRKYSERHFAQVLSVYPAAYKLRVEDEWTPIGGNASSGGLQEYVIEPNLADDLLGFVITEPAAQSIESCETELVRVDITRMISPMKGRQNLSSAGIPRPCTRRTTPKKTVVLKPATLDPHPKFLPWRGVMRSSIFRHLLVGFLHKEHLSFLDSIGFTIDESVNGSLQRFHPDFDIEAVKDIPEAPLPYCRGNSDASFRSMREYIRDFESSANSLPDRILKSIDEASSRLIGELGCRKVKDIPEQSSASTANNKSESRSVFHKNPASSSSLSSTNKVCPSEKTDKLRTASDSVCDSEKSSTSDTRRGKPSTLSILERIREKEKQKKLAEMTRDPAKELRLKRVETIARSMLRSICCLYTFKKVTSISMTTLVDQLKLNDEKSVRGDIERNVDLLCEVAPDYVRSDVVSGVKYIKLVKNDFDAIEKLLEKEIAALRQP